MENQMVRAKDVVFRYSDQGRAALDGVSMEVRRGEFVAVLDVYKRQAPSALRCISWSSITLPIKQTGCGCPASSSLSAARSAAGRLSLIHI